MISDEKDDDVVLTNAIVAVTFSTVLLSLFVWVDRSFVNEPLHRDIKEPYFTSTTTIRYP